MLRRSVPLLLEDTWEAVEKIAWRGRGYRGQMELIPVEGDEMHRSQSRGDSKVGQEVK
ncbi:MAG: hypothetical protein ACE5HC_11440 [Candidatus Binatia bacterium]